jgi:hypothetical protein
MTTSTMDNKPLQGWDRRSGVTEWPLERALYGPERAVVVLGASSVLPLLPTAIRSLSREVRKVP